MLGFALASLVPAAAVTLLLINQPSIADRRVFPYLRLPLAVLALGLALGAVVSWVVAHDRLSRPALTGLALVGVTTLLCIGPLLEGSAQQRFYALDLKDGRVMRTQTIRANESPRSIEDFVMEDDHGGPVTGSDPQTGEQVCGPRDGNDRPAVSSPGAGVAAFYAAFPLQFPGERVAAAAPFQDRDYAYIATDGADDRPAGLGALDRTGVLWRVDLSSAVVADQPTIAVNDAVVAVAGGGRMGASTRDGGEQWTVSVVSLGRSRQYALSGAVQRVVLTDCRLFLSLATE